MLPRRVANFGVVVTGHASGVTVTPRIVFPGDENHLLGLPALPIDENPYQDEFGRAEPVAGVVAPASRTYDVVFDTPTSRAAGPFTFRLWIDDTTPPSVKLLTTVVPQSGPLRVSVRDAGSGVDPHSLTARVDSSKAALTYASGRVSIALGNLAKGRHVLQLTASDYQETKNMESFGGILPNTRVYRATFAVR